VVRSLKLPF